MTDLAVESRQMITSSGFEVAGDSGLRVAWEDGDRVFCRG
jgi:hypothetical protein